jgi:hypothetical protein
VRSGSEVAGHLTRVFETVLQTNGQNSSFWGAFDLSQKKGRVELVDRSKYLEFSIRISASDFPSE